MHGGTRNTTKAQSSKYKCRSETTDNKILNFTLVKIQDYDMTTNRR